MQSIQVSVLSLPIPVDFYTIGKKIQNSNGESIGFQTSEDCRFCAFFGFCHEVMVIL